MRCTSAVQNTRNESSTRLCIRESLGTQLQQLTFTKDQRESASVQRTSDSGRYLFIHWAGGRGGGGWGCTSWARAHTFLDIIYASGDPGFHDRARNTRCLSGQLAARRHMRRLYSQTAESSATSLLALRMMT